MSNLRTYIELFREALQAKDANCAVHIIGYRDNELLPCPFCGNSEAPRLCRDSETEELYLVHCRACGASAATCDTDDEAVTAWNERTDAELRAWTQQARDWLVAQHVTDTRNDEPWLPELETLIGSYPQENKQ